eukprot:453378_1
MGNKHPKECTNEQAKNDKSAKPVNGMITYPQLLKLGYHWSLAYQAAQEYPNNIDAAIKWITSKQIKSKSSSTNSPQKADDVKREKIKRLNWKVGSKCQIFSDSSKKWFIGAIIKIHNDNQGEWLTVQYISHGRMRTKQAQRNDRKIKPIPSVKSKNMKQHKAEKVAFKVSVGIDFGTDGLGLAYSIKGSDGKSKVYVHDNWKTKNFGRTTKPKTIILLDNDGQILQTGLDAKHIYNSFDGSEKDTYLLFDRFKMSLYEEQLGDEK